MLTFQEENHIYRYDDIIIPSVTQILNDVGLNDSFPDELAAERGKDVHLACQYYDEKDLDESTISDIVKSYLAQYKLAAKSLSCQIIENEKRLFSRVMRVAGTVDRIIRLKGQSYNYIVDIKTGIVRKSSAYQLAGYRLLAIENGIDVARTGYVIDIKPEKFRILEYLLSGENEEIFKSAALIYHSKRR